MKEMRTMIKPEIEKLIESDPWEASEPVRPCEGCNVEGLPEDPSTWVITDCENEAQFVLHFICGGEKITSLVCVECLDAANEICPLCRDMDIVLWAEKL